ncbi:hypothetical protein [Streptomyces thermodiastaticus]|uniref:hypothetical protein n=1 Tax=Streptomyces thermodiastaticus TaxID=44061 RepID=UPI00167AA877|nr:hypothetical protein [Streptomyces thermodiastaticus]MCE7552052.1 hypothetical protein [Streptomyces thermodiastaticus]GHF78320.1 hypothetical protein GCM10018787_28910 [Streptomyces thermodiastaticus]
MDPLSWLFIPLLTGLVASLWNCCSGRTRRADVWSDVQRYDRVREALGRAVASVAAPTA